MVERHFERRAQRQLIEVRQDPGRDEIPARLDNDSFVFNYSGRIPTSGAYHQALTEWILAYHERTGNPNDRIVRFDCYEVDDDSPPIGETKSAGRTPTTRRATPLTISVRPTAEGSPP